MPTSTATPSADAPIDRLNLLWSTVRTGADPATLWTSITCGCFEAEPSTQGNYCANCFAAD